MKNQCTYFSKPAAAPEPAWGAAPAGAREGRDEAGEGVSQAPGAFGAGPDEEAEAEASCEGAPDIEQEPEEPPPCTVDMEDDGWASLLSPGLQKRLGRADRSITSEEQGVIDQAVEEGEGECDADMPEYWMDMCDEIGFNTSEFINLQKNPEGYTGFNGTHIWNEMYSENCFTMPKRGNDMCYEERVLYRILSGMHASVNIHIAMNYYPPMKGKRDAYEANPAHFFRQYGDKPELLKNLHFAFVVMLRALRKAGPVLWDYSYEIGDPAEDRRTKKLVRRVLDTYVLDTCEKVFDGFDEKLMFSEADHPSTLSQLKREFKGIYQKLSHLLDCVTCQKCKLHGKVSLAGVGTALKILLLPDSLLATAFHRSEVVAFFNTLHKFSSAIEGIDTLTAEYWAKVKEKQAKEAKEEAPAAPPPAAPVLALQDPAVFDAAVGAVATSAKAGALGRADEDALIDCLFAQDFRVLSLAKNYLHDPARFVEHALRTLGGTLAPAAAVPDAVVVGGGLAGLSAALTLLDRGAAVTIVDKEGIFGGNSAWASSGINAVADDAAANSTVGDSVATYLQDTLRSGGLTQSEMVTTLATKSGETLSWIRGRLELPLEQMGQMGGHTKPRTYRPSTGLAGSELIAALQKQLKRYVGTPALTVMKKTKVTGLLKDEGGAVTGVEVVDLKTGAPREVRARNVILATGGFANNKGGDSSLVAEHRPDLMAFATTNGRWATGDGHKIAEAAGAALVDMEHIQVHPTGFLDPQDPAAETKTLCAEILRGVGGILLDKAGRRFVNELGTRDYVSAEMLRVDPEGKAFTLVLNAAAAREAPKHIPLYKQKGLLFEFASLPELAAWMGVEAATLRATLAEYDAAAAEGRDEFGKETFNAVPFAEPGPFFAGTVTPVLHYTMGGIKINTRGEVLGPDGRPLRGLYAAGEAIGGLHGKNRLGGNALTECLVFGRIIGETLELQAAPSPAPAGAAAAAAAAALAGPRKISAAEVALHNEAGDCWVALHGKVYDLTDFAEDHPAGAHAVTQMAGTEGTETFKKAHGPALLDDFEPLGDYEG